MRWWGDSVRVCARLLCSSKLAGYQEEERERERRAGADGGGGSGGGSGGAGDDGTADKLRKQLQEKEYEIKALEHQQASVSAASDAIKAELEAKTREIYKLHERVDEAKDKLQLAEKTACVLREGRACLCKDVNRHAVTESVVVVAVVAVREGRTSDAANMRQFNLEVDKLRAKLAQADSTAAAAEKQRDSYRSKVDELSAEVQRLTALNDRLRHQLDDQTAESERLRRGLLTVRHGVVLVCCTCACAHCHVFWGFCCSRLKQRHPVHATPTASTLPLPGVAVPLTRSVCCFLFVCLSVCVSVWVCVCWCFISSCICFDVVRLWCRWLSLRRLQLRFGT